ncbi:MAG: hypothetical protein CM15mP81_15690 [Alphaproteobacteria bacterium]|nr:MAG: hypothetical protein CM15mP81_15690 [Alphaproteobacteria bacterium]
MAKFVRASMKGWAWARENSDAAADIVLIMMTQALKLKIIKEE